MSSEDETQRRSEEDDATEDIELAEEDAREITGGSAPPEPDRWKK
jgi:hypothetical protein